MVRCPFCGLESSLEDFKMLRESWKYGFYEVRRLECPKCKGVFNYYEGFHREVSAHLSRLDCERGLEHEW